MITSIKEFKKYTENNDMSVWKEWEDEHQDDEKSKQDNEKTYDDSGEENANLPSNQSSIHHSHSQHPHSQYQLRRRRNR
jgi:hypothetical protein